jgi:hypothetical protein
MVLTFLIDEIEHFRSVRNGLLTGLHFAVKDAERIGLKPPLAIFTELKRLFL